MLICPALDPDLSSKAHAGPFGGHHTYSRVTLDRWIRLYRTGGFEALLPSVREPGSRIDTTVLEVAVALKRESPAPTAAQTARILRTSLGYSPSESTLLRLFHRRELMGPRAGQPAVFGRYEADAPNDRWVGDALHGPKVGGRKTYLFAFLDDHSRLITGYPELLAGSGVGAVAGADLMLAVSKKESRNAAHRPLHLVRPCGGGGGQLLRRLVP